MFSRLTQILIVVILGLCVALWFQFQSISNLKAKNTIQAQTISLQSESIKKLKQQEEINRQLTLEISRLESESRSKSDDAINSISHDEKSADAYNASAPRSIVEFLRK
ncbi:DUF2570 family protein [Pasteurella multocida]|uniref:DUF2570 family protein n=1 Tax=Pasteurella multocida TaxID=747 RepID=UPI000999DE01|nr:DUF2570 family protein [Pasteurella multocida]ARA70947.1 hypothetical protein BTV67_10465 [Pasteurella multocida subsp. multocida]ARA88417.1 hypothetical protein BTV66_01760 [Pasteurella multocida subsp. septica]MCL7767795.1 DUF2570 domain-containing protein [Pasteurella multocida]MCL7778926.1 DUF2570 domain-containing protein [Pasteurella multocida]MCL7833017.1 DUF2570 domain-containing protein [Pasteurella multocida]